MDELDKTKTRLELIERTYVQKLSEMEHKMSDLQIVIDQITKRIHTGSDPRTLRDILHDFDELDNFSRANFEKVENHALQRYEKLEKEIQSNRERYLSLRASITRQCCFKHTLIIKGY